MRYFRMVGLSVAVGLVFTASPLDAQERVRDGFWGGVGGGVGFNLTENSEGERLTGFSAFARAGWALTPSWLVAGDVIGWFYSQDEVDLRRGFLGGSVLFYPSATGGFYLKGGIGGAFADVSAGVASDGTTWGFGWTLGFGYDIRLGDTFNLTLGADWLFQDVNTFTQSNNQVAMLTLGLTLF
jgi:hypothetical protein